MLIKYIMTITLKSSFTKQPKNLIINSRKIKRGIFCDITKTLVELNPETQAFCVNEGVRMYLRQKRDEGNKIHLISKIQDNANASETSLVEEFGPINAKTPLKGITLEKLIDDNPDYLQAKYWIDPTSESGRLFFSEYKPE